MKHTLCTWTLWAAVASSACMNLDLTREVGQTGSDTDSAAAEDIWRPDLVHDLGVVEGGLPPNDDGGDPLGIETEGTELGDLDEDILELLRDPDDTDPPEILMPVCAPYETPSDPVCLTQGPAVAAVRLITDEPTRLTVVAHGGDAAQPLQGGFRTVHVVLVRNLPTDEDSTLLLHLDDPNDNRTEFTASIRGGEGETVVITEVLADPLGPEPAQEFVEIFNYGLQAVDLSNWMIDDEADCNGDLIAEGTWLHPGQAAILVSDKYNPENPVDVSPPPGTLIIDIGASIGTSGLKNSVSESIELYDATGALVSQFNQPHLKPKEGISLMKVLAELPEIVPDTWQYNADNTSTPGLVPSIAPFGDHDGINDNN